MQQQHQRFRPTSSDINYYNGQRGNTFDLHNINHNSIILGENNRANRISIRASSLSSLPPLDREDSFIRTNSTTIIPFTDNIPVGWDGHAPGIAETAERIHNWKLEKLQEVDFNKLQKLLEKQKLKFGRDMFEELQDSDQPEITILEKHGFAFEEAVLFMYNRRRGLKLPIQGSLNPRSSENSSQEHSHSSLPQQQEEQEEGQPLTVELPPKATTAKNNSEPPPPPSLDLEQEAIDEAKAFFQDYHQKYFRKLSEIEQIRMGIFLSQQETQFGKNMFDCLYGKDYILIRKYLMKGYHFEDIVYRLYCQKYGEQRVITIIGPNPPYYVSIITNYSFYSSSYCYFYEHHY
jgi:hypothetical protein